MGKKDRELDFSPTRAEIAEAWEEGRKSGELAETERCANLVEYLSGGPATKDRTRNALRNAASEIRRTALKPEKSP